LAAIKKKYAQFLPDLACRADLNTLIQWMCSELSVGHHRITNAGDMLNKPQTVSGGLLGADYTIANNRYQIKKIYGGLNWNPTLRSPLTEPGVNAKVVITFWLSMERMLRRMKISINILRLLPGKLLNSH